MYTSIIVRGLNAAVFDVLSSSVISLTPSKLRFNGIILKRKH
jgi:hypothetical protein